MKPLWQPTLKQVSQTQMWQFLQIIHQKFNVDFDHYDDLYHWSVENIPDFWRAFWEFSKVICSKKSQKVVINLDAMTEAKFFPEARLNYAENILKERHLPEQGSQEALIFWGEDKVKRSLTFDALKTQVACVQDYLRQCDVRQGDRVAGFMPNVPETIVAMLATVSLGAIWTSCSPDFGIEGLIDRFGQTEPKVLFTTDGYYYNGQWYSAAAKIRDCRDRLPSVTHIVVSAYGDSLRDSLLSSEKSYQDLWRTTPQPLTFAQVPFNHPLFILYSSGTTGKPKCIVHGHGGTLLQLMKEHQLHCDIRPQDRVFFFTTCGWMMWHWLVTSLASNATVMLYDGSPFYPHPKFLFDYAEAEKFTFFGTSAKFLESLRQQKVNLKDSHDLSAVRMIGSTGSPLSPEAFHYVYEAISEDVCLSSMSGGTDIISCFALGNPMTPVWPGELQTRGLGLKVEVFNDSGRAVLEEKGELVCTAPFPSMPVGFWQDPSNEKYHDAYFSHFPNIWWHGDFVKLTEHQGLIIYGRSDSTLNPGGVRIGTAEIYRQMEHIDEIVECVAVGQHWHDDERVILFVHLKDNLTLDSPLIEKIKHTLRANTTPRHVPAVIVQVSGIPRTMNGKLAERAVTDAIEGKEVKNKEALINPETLEFFAKLPELKK
ncbi:MAG: acetoacetate--CoA ligase [Janthinobacterium lividum]